MRDPSLSRNVTNWSRFCDGRARFAVLRPPDARSRTSRSGRPSRGISSRPILELIAARTGLAMRRRPGVTGPWNPKSRIPAFSIACCQVPLVRSTWSAHHERWSKTRDACLAHKHVAGTSNLAHRHNGVRTASSGEDSVGGRGCNQ